VSSVAYRCTDSPEDPMDVPGSSLVVPTHTALHTVWRIPRNSLNWLNCCCKSSDGNLQSCSHLYSISTSAYQTSSYFTVQTFDFARSYETTIMMQCQATLDVFATGIKLEAASASKYG